MLGTVTLSVNGSAVGKDDVKLAVKSKGAYALLIADTQKVLDNIDLEDDDKVWSIVVDVVDDEHLTSTEFWMERASTLADSYAQLMELYNNLCASIFSGVFNNNSE